MESNVMICRCMKVDRDTIVKAVKEGAVTVADVNDKTGAAGGCGRCQNSILEVIASVKK
ncbi:MAG: (2Fe-2S)-binding protein [Bacteroidales bacterium]